MKLLGSHFASATGRCGAEDSSTKRVGVECTISVGERAAALYVEHFGQSGLRREPVRAAEYELPSRTVADAVSVSCMSVSVRETVTHARRQADVMVTLVTLACFA